MQYDFTHAPSTELLPGDLRRIAAVEGRSVRFSMLVDDQPTWNVNDDTGPGWLLDQAGAGLDAEPAWLTSPSYQRWPWRLVNAMRESHYFRISIGAGVQRPIISNLELVLEGTVTAYKVDDLAIAVGGTRVPLPGPYHFITEILIIEQDDGGSAVTVKVVDRNPLLGPLIVARDSTAVSVTATVDVTIKGVPK